MRQAKERGAGMRMGSNDANKRLCGLGATLRKRWAVLSYAMALYLALSIAGCGSAPPKTNLAHDLYPTALLAEPIKLRAGYEHVTQPFEVEGPEQSWSIELGLERHDDPNQANGTSATTREFFCNATSRKDMLRDVRKCSDTEPGIHLRWELFTIDGKIVRSATYDALLEKAGHTSTIYAVTVGLKGFTSLPKGTYRLKVVVLRDFLQLDANSPQILVSPPFFRKH